MDVDNYIIVDGKKFIWDGETYENHKAAEDKATAYKRENFETQILEKDGLHLVYSRRVVTEVVVEGDSPI